MDKAIVSAQRLRELLHYDPETGVFTRLVRTSRRNTIGEVVGSLNSKGYLKCCLDNGQHYMHRLAFLYMTGAWPEHQIDHVSGVRDDNRWCNLRAGTNALNCQNLRVGTRRNAAGLLGVRLHTTDPRSKKPWTAQIGIDGKRRHLGMFPTAEAAHEAYVQAKRRLHPWGTI